MTNVSIPIQKQRLFLESDVLHEDKLHYAQRKVSEFLESKKELYCEDVFDEIIDFAWHDLNKTWEAIKRCDEIYANSSLMPLVGNSYMGAPVIFNRMMERAIKEKVTGKSVFILRPLNDIYWDMIDIKMMPKAFRKNKLFMYSDNYDSIIEVDVRQLKKTLA